MAGSLVAWALSKDAHRWSPRPPPPPADAADGQRPPPPVLGPDRAPALRPRAAAERRLLAARRLPGPGRLRGASGRHAARERHPVADADHARRDPGLRREARDRRDHRPARPRGRAHRDHDRRRPLEPDKRARRWRCSAARPRTSGVRLPARPRRQRLPRRRLQGVEPPMHYDFKHLRDTPQELRDRVRQAGLAQGRRVPDPQPDAPRAPGADLPRRQGGRGQPADPPGGRHDQARRRRPLHPRALLPGCCSLSRADGHAAPAAARDAHGPARARRSGTRSSARTTAAPT